jgi:hypothetical protein
MKKLEKNQLAKVSRNLEKLFNHATIEDIVNGKDWYYEAHKWCKNTTMEYDNIFSPMAVASVLSALSPNNKWEQNKKDVYKVLSAVMMNWKAEDIKVCTFHSNKYKAFEIAKGNLFIDISARKTFSFVNNISELNDRYVTIDLWHLRACFGKTMTSLGMLAYQQLEKLTINKAQKVGMKGFEYQAIIWLVAQRLYNNEINQIVYPNK